MPSPLKARMLSDCVAAPGNFCPGGVRRCETADHGTVCVMENDEVFFFGTLASLQTRQTQFAFQTLPKKVQNLVGIQSCTGTLSAPGNGNLFCVAKNGTVQAMGKLDLLPTGIHGTSTAVFETMFPEILQGVKQCSIACARRPPVVVCFPWFLRPFAQPPNLEPFGFALL